MRSIEPDAIDINTAKPVDPANGDEITTAAGGAVAAPTTTGPK
ncbi:MAG: hypothetical protein ABW161_18830 [Candidatus Thiodiazotropha sp.]